MAIFSKSRLSISNSVREALFEALLFEIQSDFQAGIPSGLLVFSKN